MNTADFFDYRVEAPFRALVDAIEAAAFFQGCVVGLNVLRSLIDMSAAREEHGRDKGWMDQYTYWFIRQFRDQLGCVLMLAA